MPNQAGDPSPNQPRPFAATMMTIQIVVAVLVTTLGMVIWWGLTASTRKDMTKPAVVNAAKSQPRSQEPRSQLPQDLPVVSRPPHPAEGYIGSAACTSCHPQVAERYNRTAMGRSLAKVDQTAAPHEDYNQGTSFDRGNRSYRVEKTGAGVWHHESVSDEEGLLYDQAEEIQYAIGSNTRGRSYLLWRNGAMFMSPISWYAKEGWDLSPTYLPDRHVRFSRRITDACLICHSGRVASEPGREHFFPQPVFYEESIGCERCHGPGLEHQSYRRQEVPSGPDPILALSNLAPAERDAVCYQCHFQGEERVLRYGRAEADFRPGMKFSDVWTVFMKGNGADGGTTSAVSQAMQMHSSRCYQSSGARLGCVSCHDPHDSPDPEQRVEFFDRRCLNCHEERGCSLASEQQSAPPAGGSCIHCHMPPLSASNIPHTSQTDHRIPRRAELAKSVKPANVYTMFEEVGAQISAIERIRAEGLMKSVVAEKRRDRDYAEDGVKLLQQALKAMPDDEAIQQALGGVLILSGRDQTAEILSKKMIERFPRNEVAFLRLANAAHDAGHYSEAEEFFGPLMELNPWIAVTHGRRAHTLGMLNHFDEAFVEAERALKLDPTILPLYGWLAEAHAGRGNAAKSREYKQMAQRLSKRLTQSHSR